MSIAGEGAKMKSIKKKESREKKKTSKEWHVKEL